MAVIKTIAVNMIAKTAAFDRGMKKSQRRVSSFQKASASAAAAVRTMATAFIAAVGIRALGRFVSQSQKAIDVTAKLSDRLNIATEDIIGLRHAAEIMGSSSEAMDKSLEMFVRRLGEVRQGTGEAKRALEELGLDVNKLVTLSPAKAFRQIADEINNMTNQSDKAAAAYQLFGRQGVKLMNTMSLGSAGLNEMQREAEKLGLTFSRLDAARVEEANDAVLRMKEAFVGVSQAIAIRFAPHIEAASAKITDMTIKARSFDSSLLKTAGSAVEFSVKLGAVLLIFPRVIKGITAITASLKALAVGGTITQAALGGPAFWIKLAAGIGVAAIAVKKIDDMFSNFSDTVEEFSGVAIATDKFLDTAGFSAKIQNAEAEVQRLQKKMEQTQGSPLQFGAIAGAFQRSGSQMIAVSGLADELARAEKNLAGLNKQFDHARKQAANAKLFEESAASLDKFNEKLENQIRLFGLTANEKQLDKMKKLGEALTGLEKDNFDALIAKTRTLINEIVQIETAASAAKEAAREFESFKSKIDGLLEGIKSPEQKFKDFTAMLDKAMRLGLLTIEQFSKLSAKKFDDLFKTDRLKNFADSIRNALKTPAQLLKTFAKDLKTAGERGMLTVSEIEKALKNKTAELFPQIQPAASDRGRSEAIRTAFVSVAGLTSASLNPQLREQERTNNLLERQNVILAKIEAQEIG